MPLGQCTAKLAKILLFVFNAFFFLFGAILLAIGIWVAIDKTSIMKLARMGIPETDMNSIENYMNTPSLVQVGAYVLIAIGAFTFVVGFLGCCGAAKSSKCLLYLFAFLVGVVFCIEIIGAILCAVYQGKLTTELNKTLNQTLNLTFWGLPYGYNDSHSFSLYWDIAMMTFECCGVNGPVDFTPNTLLATTWYENRWYPLDGNNHTKDVKWPVACCRMKDSPALLQKGDFENFRYYMEDEKCPVTMSQAGLYTVGCQDKILDYVATYSQVLIGVAVAVAVVELLGILCACCLIRHGTSKKGVV